MSETNEIILSIIASAGSGTILAGALVWLARSWISERLRQSIQHEYDQKLSALNAELQAQVDTQVVLLKATVEKESDKLKFATATISESKKLAIAKKLESIELLWGGILKARQNVPAIMGFIDILTVDEYASSKDHPQFKQLVGELSVEKMGQMYNDNVGSLERIRPYAGEFLWALFSTYQALVTRVLLLLHWGEKDSEKLNWHKDHGIKQLLESSLSGQEIADFEQVKIGKIGWLQRLYEGKILSAMQRIISGQEFGDEALIQAQRMEEQVEALKKLSEMPNQ